MPMKTYRLTRPEDYKGLMKVSLVDDPAIQSNLMHFSEEKEFLFQDDEQRIIYAPALIPNKLIFRKNINGEPANVYFDADTIRQLHIDGMRNNYDNRVNLNHQKEDTSGIFCFEQWIIEDSVNDKSVKLGFELPVGTLMKGYKIDNNQVWQDVKDGKLKGLSIEGQLYPEEQQQKVTFKKEDMNKKGLIALALEKFKEAFKFADATELAPGFFGNTLDLGAIISDKDGNAMPEATFTVDGKVYETDDMGAINSIEDAQEEATEDATGGDDSAAEIDALNAKIADLEAQLVKATTMAETAGNTNMANEEATVKLQSDLDALKLSSEKTEEENTKLKAELIELKAIPKIPTEDNVPYEKMTNAQKVKFNRNK